MKKFLIAENFQHNHKDYKKGKTISFEEIEKIMTEKQAMALKEAGCLKEAMGEEASPEAAPAEQPEEAPLDEEFSDAPAEGKKKKGKK